jgi:hypothetical protein
MTSRVLGPADLFAAELTMILLAPAYHSQLTMTMISSPTRRESCVRFLAEERKAKDGGQPCQLDKQRTDDTGYNFKLEKGTDIRI